MRQKGFAPIIILILLVLVAFGAYYFGTIKNKTILSPTASVQPSTIPSSDPTVNWKTYIDSGHNYSFKYPSSYVLGQHLTGDGVTLAKPASVGIQDLVIDFNPNYTKADLGTFTNDRRNSLLQVGTANNIDTTTLSGITVKHYYSCGEKCGDDYFVGIDPNYILEIEVLYSSKDVILQYKPLADQILSTFKFTNSNVTKCTSDKDCPNDYFCDHSSPGGMGPNGYVAGQISGSQQCVLKCQNNAQCPSGQCQNFDIITGDINMPQTGCKL